jgi:hypothetical protein
MSKFDLQNELADLQIVRYLPNLLVADAPDMGELTMALLQDTCPDANNIPSTKFFQVKSDRTMRQVASGRIYKLDGETEDATHLVLFRFVIESLDNILKASEDVFVAAFDRILNEYYANGTMLEKGSNQYVFSRPGERSAIVSWYLGIRLDPQLSVASVLNKIESDLLQIRKRYREETTKLLKARWTLPAPTRDISLEAENRGELGHLWVGLVVNHAGQIFRGYSGSDHGIDAEIESEIISVMLQDIDFISK